MIELSPIVTPFKMIERVPIQTFEPIITPESDSKFGVINLFSGGQVA
jgi:hypothetical protein